MQEHSFYWFSTILCSHGPLHFLIFGKYLNNHILKLISILFAWCHIMEIEIDISDFISDCSPRYPHESKNDSLSFRKKVCNSLWDKVTGRFTWRFLFCKMVITESNVWNLLLSCWPCFSSLTLSLTLLACLECKNIY